MKIKLTAAFLVLACILVLFHVNPANAQSAPAYQFTKWHPALGSWFGRAVPIGPCTPGSAGCLLPPDLFMVLNIADDGSFIGNDSLTFGALHTTAHGQWIPLSRTQISANYVVLAGSSSFAASKASADGTLPVTTPFLGAFRMRWLADSIDLTHMEGFVNVYFFPFNVAGSVDQTTWVPTPDPLMNLGPFITDKNLSQCDPTKGCLGVFKFKIRRVDAQ